MKLQYRRLLIGTRRLHQSSSLLKEEPRINQLGIQYLSEGLHKKIFVGTSPKSYLKPHNQAYIDIAKSHLAHHELLGKKTQIHDPIDIQNFPKLVGNKSLEEHFHEIGTTSSEPYLSMCNDFLNESTTLPVKPSKWLFKPGWYRYEEGKDPEPVKYPLEKELVFDVEVLYKRSPFATLATAVSKTAWYGWVSPFLTSYAENQKYDDWEHLIPMNTLAEEKLLIGYNVSYDRARVLEEYNIKQSQAFFMDGMALHIAVSGLCSTQRPLWQKHKKSVNIYNESDDIDEINDDQVNDIYDETGISTSELAQELVDDPWLDKGAPNSLASVADFHCGIKLDKSIRSAFDTLEPMDIVNDFNNLMDYCAEDVVATYEVTKTLFPVFKDKIPHPVSFAALRHLGTLMLPTTKKWENYTETAEGVYQQNRNSVTEILKGRVEDLVEFIKKLDPNLKPDIENDEWLAQLNWTIKEPRLKKNGDPVANQAYLTGFPEWYRELFKSNPDTKERELNISVRTRIVPFLLRLRWEGYPLFWTDSNGWCFKVPYNEAEFDRLESKSYIKAKLSEYDLDLYQDKLENMETGELFELFKVPHPDGNAKRCTAVMSKPYSKYFENGVLTSEYSYAQEILDLNNAASYWMGNRARILNQFVVYSEPKKNTLFATKKESKNHPETGIILPKLVSMGTITRRATENTWLTASNAKTNRIGSELKSLVEAPEGYTIVGADVDSEELWIAALIGDSVFKVHGSTALSWMTLEGDKNQKTDLHSKTAEILGISRSDAKIFNYGRIYGAGVKFATKLLKQCNNKLSDEEAEVMAKKLYAETKGSVGNSKLLGRRLYYGGTESVMFNALESIAHLDDPRTPALGASITDALKSKNLNKNNYLTSRTNWAIQSSGVDYLHLLIISMDYLIKRYKVDARLMITVHDEVRYLVRETEKYKAALLLQISNLWTRAMFAERLGFKELPQSVAFFSEVDIDKVLRKEVTLDCVTPSQKTPIPPGESLDIWKLLEITNNGEILGPPKGENSNGGKGGHKAISSITDTLTRALTEEMLVQKTKLEMSANKEEWKENIMEFGKVRKRYQYNYIDPPPIEATLNSSRIVKKKKLFKNVTREEEEADVFGGRSNEELQNYISMTSEPKAKTKVSNKAISKKTKEWNRNSSPTNLKVLNTTFVNELKSGIDPGRRTGSVDPMNLKRSKPLFERLPDQFFSRSTLKKTAVKYYSQTRRRENLSSRR